MRRLLLLIIIAVVAIHTARSQEFSGGAFFGIVGSEVDGDTLGGLNKVGMAGGFFTNLQFAEKMYVQMELSYVQKGSQKNADYDKSDFGSFKIKTDYIEIPVLFQFMPSNWLKFEIGPSISFLVVGKEFVDGYENTPAVDFRPVTYNAIVGASANPLPNLAFNIRFNTSINTIREGGLQSGYVKRFPFFEWGQYHNCLIISLQYRFLKLGRRL